MGDVTRNKRFYLAVAATLLATIVVGLGAYTRLVHAGLGCPDWPGCYGFLTVPDTKQEIALAESLYPNAPVEVNKGWAEMVHRYVAGALMLLVLVIAFQALMNKNKMSQPVKLPVFILALIVTQAAFGMWTVTLKLLPQVVTAHLLGGFATLSLLFLLTLRLSGVHQNKISTPNLFFLKLLGIFSLLVVIVQVSLGGWISSNYAALACPDLPFCQNQLFPPMNFKEGFNVLQAIGPNYLGGQLHAEARTAIHFAHRVGALATILLLVFQSIVVLRTSFKVSDRIGSTLRKLMVVILVLLTLQVCLGLSNIIWSLPLSVAVAHNLFGAILLLSLVAYNYYLLGGSGRTET